MTSRARQLTSAGLLTGLLCVSCTTTEHKDDVTYLVRHARFAEAVELATNQLEQAPDDPELQRQLLNARTAYVLDSGRQSVFAGDVEQGLDMFRHAVEIDPENQTARIWVLKTERQLAEHWLDKAQDLSGTEDLDGALAAFEKALSYVPDHGQGKAGLARVLLTMNYRLGLSKTYYDQGVEEFGRYAIVPADRSFGISLDNDPENARAEERRDDVVELRAQERLATARSLEEEGLYFAARNEYRLVLLLVVDHAEALDGYNRMDREVRARRKLEQAEMNVRRGEYDTADPLIREGSQLSQSQADAFSLLASQVEDARYRQFYDVARNLERDSRYPEAVEAYASLLEQTEFYEDAIARKRTLEEFIAKAEELYPKALAAETDEEAYAYLAEIRIVWPEYKDVAERLAVIEGQLAQDG